MLGHDILQGYPSKLVLEVAFLTVLEGGALEVHLVVFVCCSGQ